MTGAITAEPLFSILGLRSLPFVQERQERIAPTDAVSTEAANLQSRQLRQPQTQPQNNESKIVGISIEAESSALVLSRTPLEPNLPPLTPLTYSRRAKPVYEPVPRGSLVNIVA